MVAEVLLGSCWGVAKELVSLPWSIQGRGMRSTLPQPKSAAPEKKYANNHCKSNILISLKEDISFSTTAPEKHLSN